MGSNFNPFEFIVGVILVGVGFLTGQPTLVLAGASLVAMATAPGLDLGDRSQLMDFNRTGTDTALPVVYGEAKVAATLVDVRVDPSNANMLWVVAAFCHGSADGDDIAAIEDVWFDEKWAFEPTNGYPVAPFLQGGKPDG